MWVKTVRLFCDNCNKISDDTCSSLSDARRIAKGQGWYCSKGKDYCPRCKPNQPLNSDRESTDTKKLCSSIDTCDYHYDSGDSACIDCPIRTA